ncbi:MerR family transcriptional regulator [Streptomyces erythrochromogenes]|uniref:MerR family transcriptional regulator n=1 Tax=Streptomyces erythrochromogenes TaxID=285574 RepID=UPI0036454D09
MDSATLYSIGELARRTGPTVKTVRFYSDKGIVPPTERSPAGYRLYGPDALARLDLARTLRDLGIGLETVRKVLDREASVPEVAAAQADALDVQIRTLRLRRAALRAVAGRGPTLMEMDLMHRLATLSRAEQRGLISGFIEEIFQGPCVEGEFAELMRSVVPELPHDPTPEQVEARVELAGLCQDEDFRAAEPDRRDVVAVQGALDRAMRERIDEAVSVGLLPDSAGGALLASSLGSLYAHAYERADEGEGGLRRWLLARLRTTADPHVERYWRLLGAVNGWPAAPALAPVHSWCTTVLVPGDGYGYGDGHDRHDDREGAMR